MFLRRTAVAALLLTSCGGEPQPPPPQPAPPPTRLHGETIDLARAMAHVRELSVRIGPRPDGSPAEARAAAYIQRILAGAGYRALLDPFPVPGGGESANVVALPPQPDFESSRDRHLLIGAHYDTVLGSPGANDNASGVAVLLEVARTLDARPAPLPVIFVAFGGEEGGPGPHRRSLAGSDHYARAMSPEQTGNLAAMINLDMVGHGDALLSTLRINMKRGVHQRMLHLARQLGVPAREHFTPQVSDSVPFASRGIETGWLWTGVESVYHSPADSIERLTPASLDWTGRLVLATVRSLK
ncbi:MAG TPA: M28 family peptidase [Thermoanaerobaculia bacterium]|nr:M28 family peptidase [Thermoanaerobaculia bacterium]